MYLILIYFNIFSNYSNIQLLSGKPSGQGYYDGKRYLDWVWSKPEP